MLDIERACQAFSAAFTELLRKEDWAAYYAKAAASIGCQAEDVCDSPLPPSVFRRCDGWADLDEDELLSKNAIDLASRAIYDALAKMDTDRMAKLRGGTPDCRLVHFFPEPEFLSADGGSVLHRRQKDGTTSATYSVCLYSMESV
jgi:hypothetical protein